MKKAGNRNQITAEVSSVVRNVATQLYKAEEKGFIDGRQRKLAARLIGRATSKRAKKNLGVLRPFKHDTTNKELMGERDSGKIALSFPFSFVDCYGTFWLCCDADLGLSIDCKVEAKFNNSYIKTKRISFSGNPKSCIKKLCRFIESTNNLETALRNLN